MQSTEKQRLYIVSLIEKQKDEVIYLNDIWLSTPETDELHQGANYRRVILAERLSPLSSQQAGYIISAFLEKRGYHRTKARNILTELNLVPNI